MPSPSPSRPPADAPQRIAKLLARAGVASRREVERMIAEGRVALDGTALATAATVLPGLAGVTVDGRPVEAPSAGRLFLYHKPAGLLVTERDPAGRPTIYDRLPAALPRVVPVGRLDLSTEGLLLLTTDGSLKRQLELPATGVERVYRARAYGHVTQAMLEDLIAGVEIDGMRYGPIDANLERRTGANVWVELKLTEGKNREVRRVLDHLGLRVSRLIRTRYGPFALGDLPQGDVAEVRAHDIASFRKNSTRPDLPQPARRPLPRPAPVPVPVQGATPHRTAADERTPARPPSDRPAPGKPRRLAGKPAATGETANPVRAARARAFRDARAPASPDEREAEKPSARAHAGPTRAARSGAAPGPDKPARAGKAPATRRPASPGKPPRANGPRVPGADGRPPRRPGR